MDPNTKRSLEILGCHEDSTLEDAQKAYRSLIAERTAWSDVKEINWAFECIREHFSSRAAGDASAPPEMDSPADKAPSFPSAAKGVSRQRIMLASLCFIAALAVILGSLVGFRVINPFQSRTTTDLSAVIKAVKPSIITVSTDGAARGSGFVVTSDGYIVTNAHVMRERTGKATFADGSVVDVHLVIVDPERDFALLKTSTVRQYPHLRLGNSAACSEGETVIAAGTPLSFETTFTRGIISSVRRSFPAYKASFIQTDAALSPGNSGGPLINLDGDVIGINSLKISGLSVEGMGFAVSINDVKHHISGKKQMTDDDLSRELARIDRKMEEMNQWRDQASARDRDRAIEEQWERERRRREFSERVDEANRKLTEQKEKEEKKIRDEGNQYRSQMRDQAEARRKALSECLQAANYHYQSGWNDSCKSMNLGMQCRLPYSSANILEQRLMQSRNECFRLYP